MITWTAIGKGKPTIWEGKAGSGREYTVAQHAAFPGRWTAYRCGYEFNEALPGRYAAMAWCEGAEAVLHYSASLSKPEAYLVVGHGNSAVPQRAVCIDESTATNIMFSGCYAMEVFPLYKHAQPTVLPPRPMTDKEIEDMIEKSMRRLQAEAESFNAKSGKRESHKDEIPMGSASAIGCGSIDAGNIECWKAHCKFLEDAIDGYRSTVRAHEDTIDTLQLRLRDTGKNAEPVAYAIECEPGDPKLHSLSFWKQHLEQIVTAHGGKVIPLYRRP